MNWSDNLSNLYCNELTGFYDLLTHFYYLIVYPFNHDMWGVAWIEIGLLTILLLIAFMGYRAANRGPIGWFAYAEPNNWGNRRDQFHLFVMQCFGLSVTITFALASHYLWFLMIFKLFVLSCVLYSIFYSLFDGGLRLVQILCLIVLANAGYLFDFDVGFPILEPHYVFWWFDWVGNNFPSLEWFSEKLRVVLNPYDCPMDINKYLYVFFLFFLYLALFNTFANYAAFCTS